MKPFGLSNVKTLSTPNRFAQPSLTPLHPYSFQMQKFLKRKQGQRSGHLGATLAMIGAGAVLIIIIQAAIIPSGNQSPLPPTPAEQADTLIRISILATGDAMAHLPQTTAAYDSVTNTYQYHSVFEWIKPRVQVADLAIVNFETTLGGEPYKGYPQFSAPDNYAKHLYETGFDLFCLANNHAVDRYNRGVIRTIHALDSLGITHTGTFLNAQQRDTAYPLLLRVKGLRIAVLNATYGTNGISPKPPVLVNLIDTAELSSDLAKARLLEPDLIIAVMHWGAEYRRHPNDYQKFVAGFLANKGVDVIVGHHPHVLQPVEWIKGNHNGAEKDVLVIWSLGNFFSNQRDRYRDGGMFVNFEIVKHKKSGDVSIENIVYDPFWVWRNENPMKFKLLPTDMADSLINLYGLEGSVRSAYENFNADTKSHLTIPQRSFK
jgi:poly-gamma-glutamate capsule biosynthesis protein CapA/YwtB (metallophosphatase superfamily)